MHRFALLFVAVVAILLPSARLMLDGKWCAHCQAEMEDACREGTCLDVQYDTPVDHEAFLHAPVVEWGGGD